MIRIGIDPGQQGAITIVEYKSNERQIIIYDMPLLPANEIDAKVLFSEFYKLRDRDKDLFIVIEKAQSMPGQGCVAMFNYGGGYKKIIAVLEILELPFEEVRPQKWRKEFSLPSGKDEKGNKIDSKTKKQAAAKVAVQLFPTLKDQFYTPKGRLLDGRVESVLIAEYAVRNFPSKDSKVKINRKASK